MTMNEAFALGIEDRKIIRYCKENLETTKKTGQPFF